MLRVPFAWSRNHVRPEFLSGRTAYRTRLNDLDGRRAFRPRISHDEQTDGTGTVNEDSTVGERTDTTGAPQRICAAVATVSCPTTAASRVSLTLGTHHRVGWLPSSAASTAAASHPCRTASRRATDRSRRTPRLSPRRTTYLPPPRRIFTIRSMLSPCEPATTCSISPSAAIFTHTGLSHSCRPSTPAANSSAGHRQRVAVRSHAQPHPLPGQVVAAVTVGPDRPGPNVAVRCCRAAHHMTCEPRDFARVQARVNNQPARASHHAHRRFDHRHRAGAVARPTSTHTGPVVESLTLTPPTSARQTSTHDATPTGSAGVAIAVTHERLTHWRRDRCPVGHQQSRHHSHHRPSQLHSPPGARQPPTPRHLVHPKSRPQCVFRPSAHVAAARGSRRRWRRSIRRSSPVSRRAAASVQSPPRLPCDGRRACGWPQRELGHGPGPAARSPRRRPH